MNTDFVNYNSMYNDCKKGDGGLHGKLLRIKSEQDDFKSCNIIFGYVDSNSRMSVDTANIMMLPTIQKG